MAEHVAEPGEMGLDPLELEIISLRNRVRALESGETLLELGAAADRLKAERDEARAEVLRLKATAARELPFLMSRIAEAVHLKRRITELRRPFLRALQGGSHIAEDTLKHDDAMRRRFEKKQREKERAA